MNLIKGSRLRGVHIFVRPSQISQSINPNFMEWWIFGSEILGMDPIPLPSAYLNINQYPKWNLMIELFFLFTDCQGLKPYHLPQRSFINCKNGRKKTWP